MDVIPSTTTKFKFNKFIIKSAKFYKNNANPQIAEANLDG